MSYKKQVIVSDCWCNREACCAGDKLRHFISRNKPLLKIQNTFITVNKNVLAVNILEYFSENEHNSEKIHVSKISTFRDFLITYGVDDVHNAARQD